MGRSDRRAPSRICSTALELRTQQVSSSMVALTLVLPSSTVVSLSSKPPASVSSSSPPPSPDTPDQTPPACVKPSLQAWPQGVLQLMQQQVEALSSSRRNCGSNNEEQPGKRKRESEEEEKSLEMKRCEEKAAAAAGVEVELHAQSPLPEDWEQFLDLKTGELYYFHWGSCKRAKSDPRELLRKANESVQALELKAQVRGFASKKGNEETHRSCTVAAAPEDVLIASSSSSSETDNGDDDDHEEESSSSNCENMGMVALSCAHCSMFVLLSLSSPSCPSCGEYLHADHHDRYG
ncbi:unnamed protein product [Sphagnum jensenii]|uniref:WW domain-containing protein n=1 Tax=Sphagnum jensenii TaxID=128206 RepID=A0ABP0XFR6_9BRYO